MTQLETAHAAIDLSWKVKKILRDALGDDFAETNSGITPRAHGAWFSDYIGPDLIIDVRVTPADARPATAEEALIAGADEADAQRRLAEAKAWLVRETILATAAGEIRADLQAELAAILATPSGTAITAGQYERAAQCIACWRGTCGGPNDAHEHVD